jgi:hypothetical protein
VDSGDDPAPKVLLSPEGTHVLFATPGGLELLDLATARTRAMDTVPWTTDVEGELIMLAWSWDTRYVAYSVPAPSPPGGRAEGSYVAGRVVADLAILDTHTNRSVRYPQVRPVFGAAFAPDGRLAVQVGTEVWVLDPATGERRGRIGLPVGLDLVSGVGWSPDGALLAAMPMPGGPQVVHFLDATGTDRPMPANLDTEALLGWRDPAHVIIKEWREDEERDTLVEVSLVDGTRAVLSRFADGRSCEYGTQTCNAYRIQLAACLLVTAGLRDADPDRGPNLGVVRVALAVLAVGLVGGAVWFVRRRRRRRAAA